MADFDPDAYLGKSTGFDPDVYLKGSAPPVNPGAQSGFSGQVMRGATFGGSDMLQAAVGATLNKIADFFEGKTGPQGIADLVSGKRPKSWHDYYDAELQRARDEGDKYAEEHPVLSTVGQTLGGLASFNPTGGGGAKTVGGLMKTALKGAGYGAAIGGTQGFVSGRGGFENRAENALVGGGVGAALGFVTPFAFEGGRKLYNAGKAAIQGALPDSAVNSTVGNAISSLGDTSSDASADMLKRLETAKTQASKVWKNTMSAAGVDEKTPIATGDLRTTLDSFLGGLSRSEKSEIPSEIIGISKDFGASEPLKEIQDWRSKIATAGRQAARSGNSNAARILGDLADHVEDFVADIPVKQGALSADQVQAYDAARQGWKQFKQTFAQQGSPVTTALSSREFGNAAESNTSNLFIRKGAGAPEALDAYMKAVGNDPKALQAARDAFTQKFLETAQTGADQSGAAMFSPAKISSFLDQYDHVVNSKLFTPDQRALMDRIGKVADLSRAPSGGRKFVDQVVAKLAPAAAGYAGFHVGGLPGMVAGATLGTGANRLMSALENAPRDAAVRLLAESLNNPTMSAALMAPANSAASKMSPALQAKVFGILAGRGGAMVAQSRAQPALQAQ